MENKKYKAVVIGCGRIGAEIFRYRKKIGPATHAEAYQTNPRVELLGLVDTDPKKLKAAGRYFPKALLFNSAEEMFQKIKPDVVSVATPAGSHFSLVKLAAKFKTPAIVCEKPIAESIKDAGEMIKTCRENKSLLFINHQRRFSKSIREWQKNIKKGFLGEIIQGNSYYYNGLFNGGTHTVDLLIFFLGKIDWVRATINKRTSWKKDDKNIDAWLGFKNGALVAIQSLPRNYTFANFYFYGTKGRIAIKNLAYNLEYQKLVKNRDYKGYYQLASPRIYKEKKNFMVSMISHVVNCLDGKEKPVSSGEDGLAALRILFALKESAENNSKIIRMK